MSTTLSTRNGQAIANKLANRESFKTHGALQGIDKPLKNRFTVTGILPNDWANTFTARQQVIDYVVYSYRTPIAWHDTEAGWIVPDERYSVTTSKHQGKVRFAISLTGNTYLE